LAQKLTPVGKIFIIPHGPNQPAARDWALGCHVHWIRLFLLNCCIDLAGFFINPRYPNCSLLQDHPIAMDS
jgi:hypothetical protein